MKTEAEIIERGQYIYNALFKGEWQDVNGVSTEIPAKIKTRITADLLKHIDELEWVLGKHIRPKDIPTPKQQATLSEASRKLLYDKLEVLGFWIHKGLRWSEDPASGTAWKAISDLADDEWEQIILNAFNEAGFVEEIAKLEGWVNAKELSCMQLEKERDEAREEVKRLKKMVGLHVGGKQ